MNCFASFNSSPARSTTDVVPSPTSSSCDYAMSTKVLAAGWIISSMSRIVAPSFVIVICLFNLINLSIPLGPIKLNQPRNILTESCSYNINNSLASINIGYYLCFSLRSIGSFFKKQNTGCLIKITYKKEGITKK